MKKNVAVSILFTLLFSLIAGLQTVEMTKAQPRTIVVPTDYSTIQQAINAANNGDNVFVKKGMYNEDLTITKALSLVGENKDSTIIVGSGNTACLIQSDNVNVTGFTFKRLSTMRWYYDIHLLNVKYCNIFENNVESSFYGIWLFDASFNNVFNNTASGNWNGIHLTTSNHNNISSNTVTNSHNWGISTEGSNHNLILGNYVASNGWAGISLDGGKPNTNNLIAQNSLTSNGQIGIEITSMDSSNNKIVGNNITATGSNGGGAAIMIAWDSNLVMNNQVVGNQVGIKLDASKNNTVYQNLIENNPQGAIIIHSPPYRLASQNVIYKNSISNIVNLTGNVQSHSWDNGTIGNFWSNYTGIDANGDGIGDSSYIIDSLNIDHYPLVSKIAITTEIPSSFLFDFASPTPSQSPSPTITQTTPPPTLSPTPSQTPTSTTSQTPTPTPSPSISPTKNPTTSPSQQPETTPQTGTYLIAAAVAALLVVVAVAAVFLHKRK